MERLKAKRAAGRTQSTRIINEAATLLESGCNDRTAITKVLDKLAVSRDELRNINAELEDVIPIEDLERECESAAIYDDQTHETLTRLLCRLEEISVSNMAQNATSTTLSTPHAPTSFASQSFGPRIRTLTIKLFHEDVCQRTSFWEQFSAAVHANSTLSKTDKFHYLRNYLVDEAAAVIAGLPTTEACYKSAIQLLKERFGDNSRIVQQHFRALRELQPVRSPSDTRKLRMFYDGVQQNVRSLNVLDFPTSSFAAMLYDTMLQSLPQDIVVAFHRYSRLQDDANCTTTPSSEEASTAFCKKLEQLLRYTHTELETRKQCAPSAFSVRESGYHNKHVQSSSVLHASEESKQRRNKCFFCKSTNHETEACNGTQTISEKKKRQAKSMRCNRCTLKGHRANECRQSSCAQHAKADMLQRCATQFFEQQGLRSHLTSSLNATKPTKVQRPQSTAVTSCQLNEAVNLQTFRYWIFSFSETSYVRGIFDGGSQRTFIKEDLATRLRLKIVREMSLAVNTFGPDAPSQVRNCNVVEVLLRSQFDGSEHIIEAIAMPVICHDIPATPMEFSFAAKLRERRFQLADEETLPRGSGEKGISMPIGSDQLWKILSGDIIRSTEVEGLVAVKTTLAWTLQGPAKKTSFVNGTSEVMIYVRRVQAKEAYGLEQNMMEYFWTLDAMGIAPNEAVHGNADTLSFRE